MISGGLNWELNAVFTKEYLQVLTKLEGHYPACSLGDIRKVVYEMLASEYALQAICIVDVTSDRFEPVYSNRVFKCLLENVAKAESSTGANGVRDITLQVIRFLQKVKVGNEHLEKYISFKLAQHLIVSGHMKMQTVASGDGQKHLVAIVINGLSKATNVLNDYKNYPFDLECAESIACEKAWIRAIGNLRNIQAEFLPAISSVNFLFPNSFILNRNVMNSSCGSFVWHYQGPRYKFLMVAECNGFLKSGMGWKTIIHSELQRAYFLQEFYDPAVVLERVVSYLADFHGQIFDGTFDASAFALMLLIEDTSSRELSVACLNNSLYQVTRHAELKAHPRVRKDGGVYDFKIKLEEREKFYIIPSFDHENYNEESRKVLLELLRSTSALHLKDQEFILKRTFETLEMDNSKCVIGLGF